MTLYEAIKSNAEDSKLTEMDTWVDPRSKVDGWKVKVLDVFPDDYAGSTVASVEVFDPEGNSQGEDTTFIHRQKVKIGEVYDAYIDGIMAMPRILNVPDFTTEEVPDMKNVTRDMYEAEDKKYNLIHADSDKISELEKGSAFTWEGLNSDDESLSQAVDFFTENTKGFKVPCDIYWWSGEEFNDKYQLTGDNRYPNDLTFVSIPLNMWSEMGNLPMVKFQVGARWLDDIVDNNARREGKQDFNESEDNSIEIVKNAIKAKNLPNGTKVSSITDDTFNSIVEDVKSKMPGSKDDEVRNKVASTLCGMFEESDKTDQVKYQIRFVCKSSGIPCDEDFVDYVVGLHLDGFSGENLKQARKDFDELKSKNESESGVDGRASFSRKPIDLQDLTFGGDESDYKVVTTVELSGSEYDDFVDHLTSKDYEWIQKLEDVCHYANDCYYCAEVINKDDASKPHILIEPEGYAYARYAAIKESEDIKEAEDFYVIPEELQKIIDSFPTDAGDPYYDEHGYEVPDELLELSLRPPENMRVRDWMRIEAPMEYQLDRIPENLTFKNIHEDPYLFKDLAYELDSDPRDVIYNQLEDMYGEDFVAHIYEAEGVAEVDDTEKYWDATTIKQDNFLRLMKFNFDEPHGCQYIITNDANEVERFSANSDEEALEQYNLFKEGLDSGLIELIPQDLNIKPIVPRD